MPRAAPTPGSASEHIETVTPLQKVLAGTLLLSLIFAPVVAWGLYLAPFYKAPGALYRGDYFVLGLGLSVIAAAALSYLWMAVLPQVLERRKQKRAQRADEERAAKRDAARKEREDAARPSDGEEE